MDQGLFDVSSFINKKRVNLRGFFQGKRGMRQGDPLPPYLFVICMEVLTQLLNEAAASGAIQYHSQCAQISLTHLCFVDDLLVFAEASSSSIQGIKSVNSFYRMSGLQVSYNKSEVFFSEIQAPAQEQLASMLDLKISNLPVGYLEVPLISSKLKDSDCTILIGKFTTRITSFSSRFLSFAGGLQLVNSAPFSLSIFGVQMFLLPTKLIKRIEQVSSSSFLWKGEASTVEQICSSAKISWIQVCKPINEGGLGLKCSSD